MSNFTIELTADDRLLRAIDELTWAIAGRKKEDPRKTKKPETPPTSPSATVTEQQIPRAVNVPTASAKPYTLEELALAAAPLMDAGKSVELTSLIQGFGVVSLQQLPTEKYNEFAAAIRAMGAQI